MTKCSYKIKKYFYIMRSAMNSTRISIFTSKYVEYTFYLKSSNNYFDTPRKGSFIDIINIVYKKLLERIIFKLLI